MEKLRYPNREWNDEGPRWRHDTAPNKWTLTFNQMDFGAVSEEYRTDHWQGHYTWFLSSRLQDFPKTVEEGKRWLEAFFREWSRAFVSAMSQRATVACPLTNQAQRPGLAERNRCQT